MAVLIHLVLVTLMSGMDARRHVSRRRRGRAQVRIRRIIALQVRGWQSTLQALVAASAALVAALALRMAILRYNKRNNNSDFV